MGWNNSFINTLFLKSIQAAVGPQKRPRAKFRKRFLECELLETRELPAAFHGDLASDWTVLGLLRSRWHLERRQPARHQSSLSVLRWHDLGHDGAGESAAGAFPAEQQRAGYLSGLSMWSTSPAAH
jgi:hypothetical protein